MIYIFKKLKTLGLISIGLLIALSSPQGAHALKPFKISTNPEFPGNPEEYVGKFLDSNGKIDEAATARKDGLIKIVDYDADLDEFVFRVSPEYYDKYTYDWYENGVFGDPSKPNESDLGPKHTSPITERATNRYQIYALLKAVYENPEIPGFRRDISYTDEKYGQFVGHYIYKTDGSLSHSASDIYETATGSYIVDGETKTIKAVKIYSDGPHTVAKAGIASRKEFQELDYAGADFFPYFIEDTKEANAARLPLPGSTALLVELTDDYYNDSFESNKDKGSSSSSVCGLWSKFNDREEFMESIFKYVKAVTVIPTQLYVDAETSLDKEGISNPGFIFNIGATLSKCFVMTKGCNRGLKSFRRRLGSDLELTNFYGGEPFYHLFEEYSANNEGPEVDAFTSMNNGKVFAVDHNCGTSIQQQHDIVFAPAVDDFTEYNVNLMLFVPDLRFDAETRNKPADRAAYANDYTNPAYRLTPVNAADIDSVNAGKYYLVDPSLAFSLANRTYTPYTFYAVNHRPYLYFNRIQLEIENPSLIVDSEGYGGTGTEDDPLLAKVPIRWSSNYNSIVGHNAPQVYQIHRVVMGKMQLDPIPLDSINLIDAAGNIIDRTETTWIGDDGYIHSSDDMIYAQVIETVKQVFESDDTDDIYRVGNEVSYIVQGRREGNQFIFTPSNAVINHLPGNELSSRLVSAESEGQFWAQRNKYRNTIELIYNGYNSNLTDAKQDDNIIDGNISFRDLVVSEDTNYAKDDFDYSKLKPNRDVELRVYRVKVVGSQTPVPVATYRWPENDGDAISIVSWSDKSPQNTAVVYTMERYMYQYDKETGKLKYDSNGVAIAEIERDDDEIQGEDNQSYVTEYYDSNGRRVKGPLQGKLNFGRLISSGKDGGVNIDLPWLAMDDMKGVFTKFVDDFYSDMTGFQNVADRFRYYFCLVPVDSKVEVENVHKGGSDTYDSVPESDQPRATAEPNINVTRISNFTNVYIPKRSIFAGFVPYSEDEVLSDIEHENLLEPNDLGLAVHVLNNQNVERFILYSKPKDSERILTDTPDAATLAAYKPVARIDRYPDGYFRPAVYSEDGSTYTQLYQTPDNYSGRIIITGIPEKYKEGYDFTAVIHYYTGGDFDGNTYIMPTVEFPKRPVLTIDEAAFFGKAVDTSNAGTGPYRYEDLYVNLKVENHIISHEAGNTVRYGFNEANYGIWSTPVGYDYTELAYHPQRTWFSSGYTGSSFSDADSEAISDYVVHTLTVDVTHPEEATTTSSIDFLKHARLYAELPASCNISVDADTETGYLVTDASKYVTILVSNNVPSGVNTVNAENDADYEYYNLQGIRIAAENLTPGIYIRKSGTDTVKVYVK